MQWTLGLIYEENKTEKYFLGQLPGPWDHFIKVCDQCSERHV